MSMLKNLMEIKEHGINRFIIDEEERRKCSSCGSGLCVHRKECLECGKAYK